MKKIDFIAIILFPLIVFISVFFFDLQINYFTSLILIFGIPSIYLSFKTKKVIGKVALFSLLVSIPFAFIFELVALGDNSWTVPHSILPYRLLGLIPLEDFLWMFLVTYIILLFYEHFCDKKLTPQISKRMKIMDRVLYISALILLVIFLIDKDLLNIPYFYLYAGIVLFIIPITFFIFRYPHFIVPFFKVSAFFFYVHLLFELVGLKLNHWNFPGEHYLWIISLFGLRFPIEEFLFVIVLGGFAACSYYEFFTDKKIDQK